MFTQPLGASRSEGIRHLDDDAFDFRHITNRGDQIIMQVLCSTGNVFFHQGKTDPLCDPTLDLALHQKWVDGMADIDEVTAQVGAILNGGK